MSVRTPVRSTAPMTISADSPGTWRHPRLDEITRRRNATTFSEKNVRQIAYGVASLAAVWFSRAILSLKYFPNLYVPSHLWLQPFIPAGGLPASISSYTEWTWLAIQIIPVLNILAACLPLMRREDDLSDIALTSAQRELLGLPPSSAAPTPDAHYSTPPRYSRTPSVAGSVGSRASYNSSPLSGRGSPAPTLQISGSESPFSPLGSPVYRTASGSGLDVSTNGGANGRRSSFGSSSLLGASTLGAGSSANLFSDPASPSPSGGKRTSVGLNSKWLYEKGRRSSGSGWMH
ncbi:nucleoporin POM34 [Geosmithia morbida]|uniref:Nucleoporin POM34 n=1 Tax=Geosmithia morbida TaxID=1094350 RepID=A0A9P4YPN7_9HYPO|nr:nucleoporin POM34 [Geosmithia morbida]KAF4120435.1 nucleoporin POM34 [Geosmithia morbida]